MTNWKHLFQKVFDKKSWELDIFIFKYSTFSICRLEKQISKQFPVGVNLVFFVKYVNETCYMQFSSLVPEKNSQNRGISE